MRTEVKHLHLALGTTSVFVTHDQEEAMTLSDLICVMRDGKIVQSGSQSEIYTKPRNLYVAEFVGKPRMSVMTGSLEHGADGVAFVGQGLRIALGPAAGIGLAGDGTALGGLPGRAGRGRDRVDGRSAIVDPGFAAKVGLMEPIGSDTFVELEAGEASLVARVDPDLSLSLDQPVSARLRRSASTSSRATAESGSTDRAAPASASAEAPEVARRPDLDDDRVAGRAQLGPGRVGLLVGHVLPQDRHHPGLDGVAGDDRRGAVDRRPTRRVRRPRRAG